MQETTSIELCQVSKTFGAVTALSELSLTISPGELTALLGPNGAGKTTAINLMLGLGTPTAGKVRVLGGSPQMRAVRSRIGSMPQESALPPGLTAGETVRLFASFYPAPLTVAQALDLADLRGLANRRAGTLSGGQKRRLAFALAAVGNPDLLLIDEPTTGMDAGSRLAFWHGIEGLRSQGRTILLTTHYLEEAERAADRVVVMNAGHILADGTPQQLREQAGGSRVRFTSDLTLAELQQLPGVDTAEVDAWGQASLRTRTPEALLSALVRFGTPFHGLEVTQATLEDAYLQITAPDKLTSVKAHA